MKHAKLLILFVLLLALTGAAQAKLTPMFPNSDFELTNLTNWHTTGQAWGDSPYAGNPWGSAPQGHWLASSTVGGPYTEALTGHLISNPFTVPSGIDIATFYIAGWTNPNIRVDFKKASDNSVLFTQGMPVQSAAFSQVSVPGFSAYAGQQIYIEVVDENLDTAPDGPSGWLAVDDFEWDDGVPIPPPAKDLLFANSDFENGDLTNWTPADGNAWNHDPTKGYPWGASPDGTYCTCSVATGITEADIGTLTSIPFTIPSGKDVIKFYIAGYKSPDFRVDFCKASDNSVIATKGMAGTSAASAEVTVKGFTAYAGQQIYIKVYDMGTTDFNPPAGWFGWFMVDGFQWSAGVTLAPQNEKRCFDNAGFELGDFTNWTLSGGAAFGTAPMPGNGAIGTAEGNFAASTLADPGTGKLTSVTFKMAKPGIGFMLSGFMDGPSAVPPADPTYTCIVNLRLASDNSLVSSAQMPWTTHVWQRSILNGWSAWGKNVYIEVIDTEPTADRSHGWIGVDDFHFIEGAEVPVELSAFSAE